MATSPAARLLLGPMLRHVGRTTATVWVQTSRPAEVEVLGWQASTFTVRGQHYALVEISGLEPGSVTTYQVHLDDHDVRDDWNTSAAWRTRITAQLWWPERIRGALASYWVYQHLGNLSPQQRHADPTWRAVQDADGDAWPVLQKMADAADADLGAIWWSYRWNIDGVRLVACGRGSALGEPIRQALDLEHWAAFRDSFHRLAALLRRVAAGPGCARDDQRALRRCAPLLRGPSRRRGFTRLPTGVLAGASPRPVVCHCGVAGRPVRSAGSAVRSVVRHFGVPGPALSWRLLSGPVFGNAVATLMFSARRAEIIFEKRGPTGRLEPVTRIELAGSLRSNRGQESDRR